MKKPYNSSIEKKECIIPFRRHKGAKVQRHRDTTKFSFLLV